jgi:hypothetical protein
MAKTYMRKAVDLYEPGAICRIPVKTNYINAHPIDRTGIAQAKSTLNAKRDADLHAASRQFNWPI